jgi:hypothetical protein
MDIRAFGSVFGQTASLPYASGFVWTPASGPKSFSTCRALFVVGTGVGQDFYVELNDMPGQYIRGTSATDNYLVPLAATSLSGGTISSIDVLY